MYDKVCLKCRKPFKTAKQKDKYCPYCMEDVFKSLWDRVREMGGFK